MHITQQFVRTVQRILLELRTANEHMFALRDTIQQHTNATREEHQAQRERQKAEPSRVPVDVSTPIPIRVHAETHESKNTWEKIKPVLETIGIAAAVVYAVLTYHMWREMIQQNDLVSIGIRQSRRDAARQLDFATHQMRQEYRAWITLKSGNGAVTVGQPISLPIRIANIGRTPAKDVEGDVCVYLMDKGEDPPFLYGKDARKRGFPSYHYSAKVIMHGESYEFPLVMEAHGKQGTGIIVAYLELRKQLQDRERWMVMYGKFSYRDAFGANHSVQFCDTASADPLIGATGRPGERYGNNKCTEYNETN
jgi:hypothetical protein